MAAYRGVRFRFANKKIEALYTNEVGAKRYARGVVDSFFDVMATLDAALDERDLYALKSLHFEALKGDRAGDHSVRLNKQLRLTLRIEKDAAGRIILVIDIEDYH